MKLLFKYFNRKAVVDIRQVDIEQNFHTILTLSKYEKYMGATPGIVSILHTNSQDLTFPVRKYVRNKTLIFSNREELENILAIVYQKKWNVHANAPFGGPAQIIEYLGRYTHSPRWIRFKMIVFVKEEDYPAG